MSADDVRDFLEGFERISVQAACKQTRGRTVVVDVWFGKDEAWEQMEPSAVDRMWAGSSLCGFMLRDHFRLSDSEYASVMKDLNRSQGLPGIYQRGEHYVIVVKLPRRRSYEDMLLGGALAASAAVIGTAATQGPKFWNKANSPEQPPLSPQNSTISSSHIEQVDDLYAQLGKYGNTLKYYLDEYYKIYQEMLTLGFDGSQLPVADEQSNKPETIISKFADLKWPQNNTAAMELKEAIIELGNRILVLLALKKATLILARQENDGIAAFDRASRTIVDDISQKGNAGHLRASDIDKRNMQSQVEAIIEARGQIRTKLDLNLKQARQRQVQELPNP